MLSVPYPSNPTSPVPPASTTNNACWSDTPLFCSPQPLVFHSVHLPGLLEWGLWEYTGDSKSDNGGRFELNLYVHEPEPALRPISWQLKKLTCASVLF